MRKLMRDAGQLDKPGLYVSRSCSYFWDTLPLSGTGSKARGGPGHQRAGLLAGWGMNFEAVEVRFAAFAKRLKKEQKKYPH